MDLQAIMTDELLAAVEGAWGNPKTRPDEWRHAIDTTVAALGRFIGEVEATCTSPRCRQRVPATTPLPLPVWDERCAGRGRTRSRRILAPGKSAVIARACRHLHVTA